MVRRTDPDRRTPRAHGRHLTTIIGPVSAAVAAPNAYSHLMGRTILTILGVLLSIWLLFTVAGMLIAALKFMIWIGLLAVIAAVVVTVISRMAKSK